MRKLVWVLVAIALLLMVVPAMAEDPLPELRIELTANTVMRGDFLEITVTNLDDYKPYLWFGEYPITAYVEEGYGESYSCNYWGKIRIPTQELDPQWVENGRFTVTVTAHSPGYEDVYTSQPFTVTEPDTEEMVFRISTEEAVTGEDYILSVNAPGAYQIEIWDFSRCIYSTWSDRCQITHGYGFTGEYPYYAKAYYYDQETDTTVTRVSDPLTVTVSAPGGDIQDPGVYVQSVIAAGEDLVFTIDETDGFATWDLNLRSEFDGTSGYHDYYNQHTYQDHDKNRVVVPGRVVVDYEYTDEGEPIPVYGDFFKPGDVYNAELCFFQYGMNGYSFDVPIMIVDEDTETEEISLTVNGQTGTVEMAAHDPVTVKVQGPKNATALMVFEGHEWRFYRGNEVTIDWGWWTMNHIPEYLFFAKYTTEPLPETEFDWKYALDWGNRTSNIVRMINRTQGYLPVPEIELNKSELTRGEWLTATITNMDDYAGYQNVSFYAAPYYEPTSQGFGHLYDWDGKDTIRIPTSDLNPENRPEPFTLSVTVNASGGWYEGNAKVPFTVVEPADQSRTFDISPKAVETGESFTLSLYAPGAEEYRILENGNEVRTGSGGSLTEHRSGPRPENRTYQAYVRYPDDEEWTIAGTADVKITATHGPLPALQLSAPATLTEGENLIISFTGIDSVDGVDVQLKPLGDWNYIWHSWGAQTEHTIYAVQPEHTYHMERLHDPGDTILEAGRIYEYKLDVSKRGYESVDLYGVVKILEKDASSDPDFILKVNGETDGADVEARLGETVDVTVSVPDNVTGVRLKNRYGWQVNARRQDGSFEGWRMSLNQSGTHPFIAQATTDQSVAEWADAHNGNMDGFDWNSVNWTLTSNTVTVNVIYYGTLEDPAVEFPNGTEVQRGSILAFNLSPVEHSNQCDVKIRRKNQDGTLSDPLIEMEIEYERTTLIQIPTDALSEGDYALCVEPRGDGYQGNEKHYDFSVLHADGWQNEPSFKASATEVLTREYVTFSIYAPGAVEVRLCSDDFNNAWKQDRNDYMVSRVMLNRVREYRVMAYARYTENGEWEQIGQDIAISVTAPNGPVELVDIDVPTVVKTDGMLTATLYCDYKGTNGYSECWITDDNEQTLDMEYVDRTVADGISRETYRISADKLAAGYCVIEAYAFPGEAGWQFDEGQAMTLISDDASIGTLTVSKNRIDLFEDVTVNVQAPGATAIALCGDGEWIIDAGDHLEESFTAWISDPKYFFALYTTQNIDPDGNEWRDPDWDGWTGRTTGAVVMVLPPRYELEEVSFELEEDTVRRGRNLVVTIQNINEGIEGVSYGAHLVPAGEDFSDFRWYGQDEDGKIRVNTFEAEPGDYDLIVSANAIACIGKTGRTRVQITALPDHLSTLKLPSGLKVISSEAFAGVSAEKIIVPAGVETIESKAFANCPNLIEIELPEGITSFARDAFAGTGPVGVYGAEDGYLAAYAEIVDNLVIIPE